MNGAHNAEALVIVIKPALYSLITPMTKFVGQVVAQSGVSVEGNNVAVAVDVQRTVQIVSGYAAVRALLVASAPVLTHLLAAHHLLGQGYRDGRRRISRDPVDHQHRYEYVQRCCLLD